jgi:hypothetical protein
MLWWQSLGWNRSQVVIRSHEYWLVWRCLRWREEVQVIDHESYKGDVVILLGLRLP